MIYLQLFISFLQIGAFSFGGGYAAMPLIQNQVVQVHPWLSQSGFVKLTGVVEEAEFDGVLTKYVLKCHGQSLKYLEKNDGRKLYQEGESVDLYINPQDIMQF